MGLTLVTGATGFVGNHLVRALVERGHHVRCTVRKTSQTESLQELGVELVEGDLTNRSGWQAAVQGVDLVFHAAARLSAPRRTTLLNVNGRGTAHLVRACAGQPHPPVFVLVSSIAAAGPGRRGTLRTEQAPARPISNYGQSKRAAEIAVERSASQLPSTIVRPGIVYGPGDRESLLPMCRMIERWGTHVIASFQSPPLSFIHVQELVALLLQAAERGQRLPPKGQPNRSAQGYYFAVAPEYPTYFQFGRMLTKALRRQRRTRYWHVPLPYPFLIAAAAETLARLQLAPDQLNVDKIREATAESWACSNQAARRDLDFQPLGSLLDQLQETVQWYRQQQWL